MNTINIDITLDELRFLMRGLRLVEKQEENRDAIMKAGSSKHEGSPHHADDLAVDARIVKERDEILSNLSEKLNGSLRDLAAKQLKL